METTWAKIYHNKKQNVRFGVIFTFLVLSITSCFWFWPPSTWAREEFDGCSEAIERAGVPPKDLLPEYILIQGVGTSAKEISAGELMDMLERGESPGPWIVHQSWKDGSLPTHFERWSKSWKHGWDESWIYVLWRDADNRRLVETYYPSYLGVYDALPREIYRADMVRNMYMHRFGGIYADLDVVSLNRMPEHLPFLHHRAPNPISMAYLGHMGDDSYPHSMPNAFMASSAPDHPFWLRPLEYVRIHQGEEEYTKQPESLTGPIALRACVKEWQREQKVREDAGVFAEMTVLPNEKIYAFSWYDSPPAHKCLCRLHSPHFSESRCRWLYPKSWALTFWTHSWGF